MLIEEVRYLDLVIREHIKRFFSDDALNAFNAVPLNWCTTREAVDPNRPGLYIPIDQAIEIPSKNFWRVQFGDSTLTLCNSLDAPSPIWQLESSKAPMWYLHPCGAVMPAWNLAPTLFELLTLKEERLCSERDIHGRFIGSMSPRDGLGLLETPIFNDSVAALVAACIGISRNGRPDLILKKGSVAQPILILSHDLDQLRGNDVWTMGARLLRSFTSRGGVFRKLQYIWFAIINTVFPLRYYFDNIIGMIEVERMLGFTSSLYILNGTGGRFGARSGVDLIPAVAAVTPKGWDLGLHYNYDTHLDQSKFRAQKLELESILGRNVKAGRAHYLRFNSDLSWCFYDDMGIRADESLGYYDRIGYRAGIAGPFHPYDHRTGQAVSLIEIPLVMMDSTLVEQYSDDPVSAFEMHLRHLSEVGGAVSLLFHPGQFNNPEYPEMLGLYRRLLGKAHEIGARTINAADL